MGAGDRWLLVILLSSWALGFCGGQVPQLSSFTHSDTWLRPYEWAYLRVEVPPWFSSTVITFVSNVLIDMDHLKQVPKSRLPVICLKDGSPPLPDVSDTYLEDIFSHSVLNNNAGGLENLRDVEQCIPFQKNLTVTLTNEQMSPGVWYIGFFNGLGPVRTQSKMTVNQTTVNKVMQEKYTEYSTCFSFEWDVRECLNGKAGDNCTWEMHMLQRVSRRSASFPFDSYYIPNGEIGSIQSAVFPLEHLLSNTSVDTASWTYFFLDVPRGAAGATMHIQFVSDTNVDYEIYFKYGGIASVDTWDYYLNNTGSSNGSMFWAFNDSNQKTTDLYIVYAKEGTWCFGMKHPPVSLYKHETTISISLQGCPRHCSSHGDCRYSVDESGSTFYSYCSCDRDHGGFDCSDELVTREGHILQSVFLIASNAAAILPAFWSLRRKAFAEWVLFTSSGISSALYHACDVGTWCVLSFHVLQFMDFWLSFMAVASTFLYMATIDEASKRAIHTCVAILTALLAVTGATRSANIGLVIAIGTLGLLIGWLLEFSTANWSRYCPGVPVLLVDERWQGIKRWLWNLMKTLQKRFNWPFMILGFIALAFAGTSWKLESNESYWIWHSLWHISIYTSSFFFLCSTSVNINTVHEAAEYELARQNSSSRN